MNAILFCALFVGQITQPAQTQPANDEQWQVVKVENKTFVRQIFGETSYGNWSELRPMNDEEWKTLDPHQRQLFEKINMRNNPIHVQVSADALEKYKLAEHDGEAALMGLDIDLKRWYINPQGFNREEYLLRRAALQNKEIDKVSQSLLQNGYYRPLFKDDPPATDDTVKAKPPFKLTPKGQQVWNSILMKLKLHREKIATEESRRQKAIKNELEKYGITQ